MGWFDAPGMELVSLSVVEISRIFLVSIAFQSLMYVIVMCSAI